MALFPRNSSTTSATWAILAVTGGVACTQPSFPELDAGELPTRDQPDSPDGGPTPGTNLREQFADAGQPADTDGSALGSLPPPGAERLVGFYARRSVFFDVAEAGAKELAMGVELALLTFEFTPDGQLKLETQLCDVRTENELGVRLRFKYADKLAPFSQQVVFAQDGTFSVPKSSSINGYIPTRSMERGCSGTAGQRAPRFDDQQWSCEQLDACLEFASWANDQCTCPGIDAALPTTRTDCRLVDADGDAEPGLTTIATQTFIELAWHMTLEVQLGFEGGKLDAAGPLFSREIHALRASCVDTNDGCVVGRGSPCGQDTGQLLFVPLASALSCAELRDRASALFPEAIPDYPDRNACAGG